MDDNRKELETQIQYRLLERLERTELRHRKVLDMLQECVFECDADLCFSYVNDAWRELLGYGTTELIGHYLTDYAASRTALQSMYALFESNAGRAQANAVDVEINLRAKNGSVRWCILRMRYQDDRWAGSLVDITDRRNIEDALRDSETEARKLAMIASLTDSMAIITDAKGEIEWVNESFEKTTGYALHEIKGKRPREFMHGPETDSGAVARLSELLEKPQPFNTEIVHYKKNGQPYWVDLEVKPVFSPDGLLVNIVAIESDITERRDKDRALHQSESRQRFLLDNMSDSILRTDITGKIQFFNPAWQALTGFSEVETIGHHIVEFCHKNARDTIISCFPRFVEGDDALVNSEIQVKTATGEDRWVDLLVRPVFDEETGDFVGAACRLSDVEERHMADEALRESRDAANQLAENKSRFLARVSHEVRTPLNAIVGISDLFSETGLNHQQKQFLRTITESSQALLELVNEVLDFSRFESSHVILERIEFDLLSAVDQAIDMVSAVAREKGLEVVVDIHPDVHQFVIGDRMRLRQVLVNLLTNAAKFTADGYILLTVKNQGDARSNCIEFTVQDSGPGIESHRIDNLFMEYVQASDATSREYGGTGLGLAICREICRAAGTDIKCKSAPGIGSSFSFSFPLEAVEQENLRLLAGKTLVSLIDSPRLSSALQHIAIRHGMNVQDSMPNQDDAEPPNLVITSGISTHPGHMILKSSASAIIQLDPRGDGAQAIPRSYYLAGPFKPCAFLKIASEALGVEPPTNDSTSRSSLGRVPLKILVAEDQSINQFVIKEILTSLGHDVHIVGDGREAVEASLSSYYDLVLMDIQMPTMDGVTATREIRALKARISQPRIIAITANALPGDEELCLSAGMDGYMTKPLTKARLSDLIDRSIDPMLIHSTAVSPTESLSLNQEYRVSLRNATIWLLKEMINQTTFPDITRLQSMIAECIKYDTLSADRMALLDLTRSEDLTLLKTQLERAQNAMEI